MTQLIFIIAAIVLVLSILPWLPLHITFKGKLVLVTISGVLAAFLLLSLSFLAVWQSILLYIVLAAAASYVTGIYGLPVWALKEPDLEIHWIEKEPELNDLEKKVPSAENNLEKEMVQQEQKVDEPAKNKSLFLLEDDDEAPVSARVEKNDDAFFEEDSYIESLYNDENEAAEVLQDDQVSVDGQNDYLAELLREMEEMDAEPDYEMEEIPLLHVSDESKQKKSVDTH